MKVSTDTKHAAIIASGGNNNAPMKIAQADNKAAPGVFPGGRFIDEYNGSYDIIPTDTPQVLETKNKAMNDDLIVYAVPVARVSNSAGGKTVTIG